MSKEILFEININELDNPFEREKLESLPNYILVELLIRHLKREIKAIEYIKNKKQFQQGCDTYQIIDWNYVLKILGDGNNE